MNFSGKTLYRNKENKMIAGICTGLSEFFDFDVSLIRLIFVLSLAFGGIGFFVYLVGAIIIPEKPNV